MSIGERIKNLRQALGISQVELADRIGVSKQTLYKYENGIITNIPSDKIEAIARVTCTTPADIMGWESSVESSSGRRIPVYGRVAAGIPIEEIQDLRDYEEIPDFWTGEYMALRVKGDSMLPRIADGDVVIVRVQSDAESGDVVVAQVNGCDATVKKLIKHQNGITLQAYNPAYDPMFFNEEEQMSVPVRIIGKVVELRGKF